MNIRHLQVPFAIALALGASSVHALGLGQIQVKSGLNEPLVAEIPILSAAPGELDELEVRLASPEAFARVGLERPVGLNANLQMSVGRNAAGQPVIRVTTPGRFNEPFLTFLVEANWGRGSLVREYSALVDPPYIAPAVIRPLEAPSVAVAPVAPPAPVFVPEAETAPLEEPTPAPVVAEIEPEPMPAPEPLPAAPEPVVEPAPVAELPAPDVVAAAPEPAAPAPVAPPEPTPPPAPVLPPEPVLPPAPAPPAAVDPGSFGPVSEGQTLWAIASSARPDRAVSMSQMMLALQRANPEAFIDDNINQLKRGAVLRIPARDEITTLGAAEAEALVREQAAAWQSRRQPVPQPAESVESAPAVASTRRPAPATPDGRLEIVPPSGDEQAARGAQSGASSTGRGSELRAELTQAREDLSARESEVSELRSQLTELEQQQSDSQRLIQMQDSQMRALQERLGQPVSEPVAVEPEPATTPVPDATPADVAAVEPAPPATAWYLQPLVLLGAGLLVLVGLVLALRGRRRSSPMPVTSRRISDDENLHASLASTRGEVVEEAESVEDAGDDAAAPQDESLARLAAAVAARPDDLETHISLLRHHYARGEGAEYEVAAQAMRIRVRSTLDPRWREAVVMGVAVAPGNPLFSQAGWNTPRFQDTGVMPATPAVASPAPASVPDLDDPAPQPVAVADVPAAEEQDEDWDRLAIAAAGERQDELDALDDIEIAPVPSHDAGADELAQAPEDDGSDTKIELAKAYLDIGDIEGARGMLEEVVAEAGPVGRAEATRLLKELG